MDTRLSLTRIEISNSYISFYRKNIYLISYLYPSEMLNFFVIISTINPLYLYIYIFIYIYIYTYIYIYIHIYIYTHTHI